MSKHERKQLLSEVSIPLQEHAEYERQLEMIRQKGYALSVEERETGTAAISVPVFHRDGHLLAALAVSGPVSRMSEEKMLHFAPKVKQAAEHCRQIAK
jgi:DNA-binding IclR family transcriptional regulator